jgi:ectoine hydroxylase-related dioxygenase (phytanoyl-CoA dioxygenase family)
MESNIEFSLEELGDSKPEPDLISSATQQFFQNGTLLVRNAFPKLLIQKVAVAFEEKYQNMSNRELNERDAVVGDQRFMITIDIKKPFNRPALYASPKLMPILESLLSSHLRIASFGAVVSWPGAEAQSIHLDHPPLFDDESLCGSMPPYAITVVVPLVDVTESMGTTAIWPGTHRCENRLQTLERLMANPSFEEAEKPQTQLGDAYLMDYRVIHGGLPNTSDRVRPILYLVYSRPWFCDGFNFLSQPSVQISDKQKRKVPKRWAGLFRG